MTTVTASAPGKVILSGEYAVLDGAPAISMAVNRRAVVTLTTVGDDNTVAQHSDRVRQRLFLEWLVVLC